MFPSRISSPYPPPLPRRTGYEEGQSFEVDKAFKEMAYFEMSVNNTNHTFYLGQTIHIPTLLAEFGCVVDFSNTFQAANITLHRPFATCLIFETGKVIVVGPRHKYHTRVAMWICCEILRACKVRNASVSMVESQLTTMVTRSAKALDLFQLKADEPTCKFVPAMFPGLTWQPYQFNVPRTRRNAVTFRLFMKGRTVITGVRTIRDAMREYTEILPRLRRYARETPALVKELKKRARKIRMKNKTKKGAAGPVVPAALAPAPAPALPQRI